MNAKHTPQQASVISRRHALKVPAAALLAATLGPTLLAACGGGGDSPPLTGGTTPQSFSVGPITGLGSIIVGGVRFEDNSARVEDDDGISHSRSALALGMMVEVHSSSIDDNLARATAAVIRFGSELKGPVASVDAGTQTLRMLDQTVEIRPETVFDPRLAGGFTALAVGQILEIHALLDNARGRFLATRIELEDNANEFRLRGLISALDTTAKTFNIGAAVINYAGVPVGDLPPLANGQRVRVRLQTRQINGQWVAISVRSGVRRVDDIADARIRGFVTAFTSPQQFAVEGIAIDATNARFEPGPGAVSLGALVEVRGRASNGGIIASRVKAIDRLSDDWRRVELHGTASELDTAAKIFVLREVKVNYSRVVEWKDGREADLANGRALEVKGLWSEDRSVLFAAVIEFE
jgi:hypothetical protein